jgi:hypothetical protein
MNPAPLPMVCLFAFAVALQLFGVVLVVPLGPPPWLWALNAVGIAYGLGCFAFWCRRAVRSAAASG